MNLMCPVDGVRRLGAIHYLTFESEPDAAKLTQLVEAYEPPLSQPALVLFHHSLN